MMKRDRIMGVNRGDSFKMPLFINIGGKMKKRRYILSYDDTVFLSICEPDQQFEDGVIRKTFNRKNLNKQGDVEIVLKPSDTEMLVPGCYYLELKIKLTNGKIATILPRRKFYIDE